MVQFSQLDAFLTRASKILDRIEPLLPEIPPVIDWHNCLAASWKHQQYGGYLQPINNVTLLTANNLIGVEHQFKQLKCNTAQLIDGLPCNHALLWGARGTGKSSLVRAILSEFAKYNLRLIEVERDNLADLAQIVSKIANLPQKFILFCDDLSFEAGEGDYRILKSVLDGSLASAPDNVLLYATSNRRHLVPEKQTDNDNFQFIEGEIHPSEAVEDKIALSDRFGLHLSFYPFNQEQYLQAVHKWLDYFKGEIHTKRCATQFFNKNTSFTLEDEKEAIAFASSIGNRNGRCAYQFAKNWLGRKLASSY